MAILFVTLVHQILGDVGKIQTYIWDKLVRAWLTASRIAIPLANARGLAPRRGFQPCTNNYFSLVAGSITKTSLIIVFFIAVYPSMARL